MIGQRPRADAWAIGDWYSLSGSASDYVVDQIPQFASDTAKKFAADYEAKYGGKPSPSAAGLSYDFTNFFIDAQAPRHLARLPARPCTRPPGRRGPARCLWTGSSCQHDFGLTR
jgi:hypothetical protein